MITKSECMSLLVKLEDRGLNVDSYIKKLVVAKEPPMEVLRFIATNQGLDLANFYEMLRVKHNKNKSQLYTNILKEDFSDLEKSMTTLSCLLTQVLLFSKKLTIKDKFLQDARAEEITRAMNRYFKDGDGTTAAQLLQLIKSDLLVLEYIRGRRELTEN